LNFTRTIDRALVHRDALGEVFLTDTVSTAEDHYLAAAQLPRSHAYYGDRLLRPAMYDSMLLLEACRQATLAAAHRHYGVPTDHKFIITAHQIHLTHPQMAVIGSGPCELTMDVAITDRREREGRVTGLDHQLTLFVAGTEIGYATMGMRYKSPESYQRLRLSGRDGTPPPSSAAYAQPGFGTSADPAAVGRGKSSNVIVEKLATTGAGATAELRIPAEHPSMFDHPQDHLPGMVLSEAARQMSVTAITEHCHLSPTKTFLSDLTADFNRFGELDANTRLEATVSKDRSAKTANITVDVGITQNGEPIAELRLIIGTLGQLHDLDTDA
jgi:hypothetical protein